MARKVFFSFHYENDINRAMIVRNSWVTQGVEKAGFIDKAEFEQVRRQGTKAIALIVILSFSAVNSATSL